MTEIRPELQKAVALFYDGSGAPQVSAKGIGQDAQAIVALAEQHGVPTCDNAALVELLTQIEIGEEIPEALYITIAHLLAFAQQLRVANSDAFCDQPQTPMGPILPPLKGQDL